MAAAQPVSFELLGMGQLAFRNEPLFPCSFLFPYSPRFPSPSLPFPLSFPILLSSFSPSLSLPWGHGGRCPSVVYLLWGHGGTCPSVVYRAVSEEERGRITLERLLRHPEYFPPTAGCGTVCDQRRSYRESGPGKNA